MATSTVPKKRRSRATKADKAVSARLDVALDRKLRAEAVRAGVSVSDMLGEAVKQFITAKSKDEAPAQTPPLTSPHKQTPAATELPLDQAWGAAFKGRLEALDASTKSELHVQRRALEIALRLLKKMAEDGLGLDVSGFFPAPKFTGAAAKVKAHLDSENSDKKAG